MSSEQREALESEIYDAIDSIHGTVHMYNVEVEWPEPTGDTETTIPSCEYAAEVTTDAVIKYLYQRADGPEFLRFVDVICSIHGMTVSEAERLIDDILTALIGPRAIEQENDNE